MIRIFLRRPNLRYPCDDYVPQCRTWARDYPSSCNDDEDESFPFMSVACMQSCGHCAKEVGTVSTT